MERKKLDWHKIDTKLQVAEKLDWKKFPLCEIVTRILGSE